VKVTVVAEQLRRRVPGGIGTYTAGLLDGLGCLETGLAVTLLAGRCPPGEDPLARFGLPVESARWPGRGLVRLWDHGRARPRREHQVLHATSQAFPPTGARLTVMVHDLSYRRHPEAFPPRGRRWHEESLARVLERADAIVTPSTETASDLRAAGARRTEVIEHGSDHLPDADAAATGALLGRLGVDGPFLLSVGTLEPRKNLKRLMAAYSSARSLLPGPWPLLIAGPRGWGAEVDPVDGVLMAGRVDDAVLAGLYQRAHLLAYVPLMEGFGLPPVEAMRAGLPVLASPMPSLGGAALEVEPADTGAIAEGLAALAGDDALAAELVRRGRARTDGLTWSASAAKHTELWRSLL
jgi:glycosyltransferase involved in cell wall biosynthesis